MDKVFANFQMDAEFFILMSLFFAISFLITIIIVYFLSKINSLNSILDQAKEIDEAKIAKIARLERELEDERRKSADMGRELRFIVKNEQRLNNALNSVDNLQSELKEETDAHTEAMRRLKIDFKQLSVHYELLNNSYTKLEDSHQQILDKNERLVDENTQFYTKLQELEARIFEQESQSIERLEMLKEHRMGEYVS